MITLTTSQQAAVNQPNVNVRLVFELDDPQGGTYRFAREPLTWSGHQYWGRITTFTPLVSQLGSPEQSIVPTGSVTVTMNDEDGFFTTRPKNWWRGHKMVVREILPDVESYALRSFSYILTGAQMSQLGQFTLQGDDLLGDIRQKVIPNPLVCLVDTVNFPQLRFSGERTVYGEGGPIPLVYGRCRAPMYLVNEADADTDRNIFCVCIGSATLAGDVTQFIRGRHSTVVVPNNGITVVYTVTARGVPITLITMPTSVPIYDIGGTVVPHFADVYGPTSGAPRQVLLDALCQNSWAATYSLSLVDTPGLAAAHSFWIQNSISLDFSLSTFTTVEQFLNQFAHGTLSRISWRDKLYMTVQASRDTTSSFHIGNIIGGSITMADVPLGSETSKHTVIYRARANDGPTPTTTERYEASPYGQELPVTSLVIGRGSVARRVATGWALQGYYGSRQYGLQTTIRMSAGIEEGDLSTLYYPAIGAEGQLCEVTRVERGEAIATIGLRTTDPTVFATRQFNDPSPEFQRNYQRVSYVTSFFLYGSNPNSRTVTITSSHACGATPTKVIPVYFTPLGHFSNSFVATTANNSEFTVNIRASIDVLLPNQLLAFDVFVPSPL